MNGWQSVRHGLGIAALASLIGIFAIMLLGGCAAPTATVRPLHEVSPAHEQCIAAGKREDCTEWRR